MKFPVFIFAVAFLCWISIIASIDPAGSYPRLPEGPGLTIDEIFNVEQGVYLVELSRSLGWLNLIPTTSQEGFRSDSGYYLPDHPPLGRWWLGAHHHLAWWISPPHQPDPGSPVVTACARTGSATAFALTVLLIGWAATSWSGPTAGVFTAISLTMMPRLFGHAHLASLETITNLTCTASVVAIAYGWNGPIAPSWKTGIITGALFGLALLTKIQAILIPCPVICWALWRWKTKAIVPLAAWSLTAFVVFFASWPWLWFAPWENLLVYLGRTTHRSTVYVWYFGQRYPDKLVPWHFPFVMFGLTVPILLHVLGFMGLGQSVITRRRNTSACAATNDSRPNVAEPSTITAADNGNFSRDMLLFACMLFPLVLFAVPGIAVYDSERLILTTFPLWAIFVGRGGILLWNWLTSLFRSRRFASAVLAGLLLWNAAPMYLAAPTHLNYYNELVAILGGVDRVGLEVDYWGEGITRQLLQRLVSDVPDGSTVAVTPTLHQFQSDEYRRQSPILRAAHIKTVESRPDDPSLEYLLVYRRRADLPSDRDPAFGMPGWTIVARTPTAFLMRRNR